MSTFSFSKSRHSRNMAHSNSPMTPAQTTHVREQEHGPSSYSPTLTPGGHQYRMNVVTRVAIEGNAKQGQDGVSIKMYLKIALPVESISPGATISLFPEENLKILNSQVHPLDQNSAPYNFSPTAFPLLHRTARALNLPPRSSTNFQTVFNSPPSRSNSSTPSSGHTLNREEHPDNTTPVDLHYTGHVLVSNYHVSFVLPKAFPPHIGYCSDNETEGATPSSSHPRRAIGGEKPIMQYMAAIDIWVPYVLRPPRAPHLLSIPTPRCLHNYIKLRIFAPTTNTSSFASLSSIEDEGNSWDLTSDPHVTRKPTPRTHRAMSYMHYADDETSDSSTTGFSDGWGIQGTFPSSERIRIRWAKPVKIIDVLGDSGDGRRRVGVKDANGEMVCIVKGKGKHPERGSVEGLIVDVEYKGTCKGVWFPGVATLLGLDVSLEANGSDVVWVDGMSEKWEIRGGVGFTGFDVGATREPSKFSLDSAYPSVNLSVTADRVRSQYKTTGTSTSLLRAPLPSHHVGDYSFEASGTTTSAVGTLSSFSSFSESSTGIASAKETRLPGVPITLHINVNELLPPAKNIFTFDISGTILIIPRNDLINLQGSITENPPSAVQMDENGEVDIGPLILPRFTVLAADNESTTSIIRNEVPFSDTLIVYNKNGDHQKDSETRKTVLQKGGVIRFGEDGGRIVLKTICENQKFKLTSPLNSHSINGIINTSPQMQPSPSKSYGPTSLSFVDITITPLTHEMDTLPHSYAVRLILSTHSALSGDYLEFGLAEPDFGFGQRNSMDRTKINVRIVMASVDGVPVTLEATAAGKEDKDSSELPFEALKKRRWINWVKIHNEPTLGRGTMVIDYLVEEQTCAASRKWKGLFTLREKMLPILLPTFPIPVGRLQVKIDPISGLEIHTMQTNLFHKREYLLLHFSLEAFFCPRLSLKLRFAVSHLESTSLTWYFVVTWAMLAFVLVSLHRTYGETQKIIELFGEVSTATNSGWGDASVVASPTTTTFFATVSAEKCRGHTSGDHYSIPKPISSPLILARPDTGESEISTAMSLQVQDETSTRSGDRSSTEFYGLLPVESFVWISWPTQEVKQVFENIMNGMEKAWQLFRKAYHYPLNPP